MRNTRCGRYTRCRAGVVKDDTKLLVERVIPAPVDAEIDAIMRKGIVHGLSKGVGQVHNPEIDWTVYPSLRRLRARSETDMRFYVFVPIVDRELMAKIVAEEGRGDDWVR